MSLSGRSLGSRSISASGFGGGVAVAQIVIEGATVVQRDTDISFLVDVAFAVFHSVPGDGTLAMEWRRGTSDPWNPATAQTYDRQHDPEDTFPLLTGLPTASPGKEFNYVWQPFFDLDEGAWTDVFVRITVTGSTAEEIIGPLSISTVVATQADVLAQSQARRAQISRTPLDFLGHGLVIPFRRGSRDFVTGSDVDVIKSAVSQILGTRAAVAGLPGELPWRPDFGSKLWILRHRNNSGSLRETARAYVRDALQWEPRVIVTDVEIEREPFVEPNVLQIRVRYRIIDENLDRNRVILPEFEEVVTLAA